MAKCLICQDELSYKNIMVNNVSLSSMFWGQFLRGGGRFPVDTIWNPRRWEVWCSHCKKTEILSRGDIVLFYVCFFIPLSVPAAALWFFIKSKLNPVDMGNWLLFSGFVFFFLSYGIGLLLALNFIWWKRLVRLALPDVLANGKAAESKRKLARLHRQYLIAIAAIVIIIGVEIYLRVFYHVSLGRWNKFSNF